MSKGNSPWGQIDNTQKTSVSGVMFVDTPSHGGYRVTAKRAKEMHPALFDLAIDYGSRYYWFEEDCDWVAVVITWPELGHSGLFPELLADSSIRANALKSLRYWQPETYKAFIAYKG